MPRLIATIGPDQAKEWALDEGMNTVGRRPVNTVVLTDPSVSRQHFSIRRAGDEITLINHSSTGGTYVNGLRADTELQLNHADQIRAGDTTLVIYLDNAPAGAGALASFGEDDRPLGGIDGLSEESSYAAVSDPLEASIMGLAARGATDEHLTKQLSLIQEIGQQLVAQLELKTLFDMILEKVFSLMPVDTGSVMLIDPDKKTVETVAVRNNDGTTNRTHHNPSKSMLLYSVAERKGLLSADTLADERFQAQESIISKGIKSAMCVPMIYDGVTLGIIYTDNYDSPYSFTENDLSLLTILANQAAIAVRNAKLHNQIIAEETKRNNLSRYLAPQIVDTVTGEGYNLELGGKLVEAAILESDIRGFTALSEPMAPADVVSMLNAYFSEMTEIVFECNGTLDKYIGDALLAAFGSPVPDARCCVSALRAAALMQEQLKEMTFKHGEFKIGIGLHWGEILHGNLGSERIMQYTVIGDTVNTAARLCDKCAPGKILMSLAFIDQLGLDVALTELDPMQFKGKSGPMRVFEFDGTSEDLVVGLAPTAEQPNPGPSGTTALNPPSA